MIRRPPSRGVHTTTTIRPFNKPIVKKRCSPRRSEGTVRVGPEKHLTGKGHVQASVFQRDLALRWIEGDLRE